MATSSLRFVILGDDKASSAFDRFARSVDNANKSVARNNAALARSGKTSATAQSSLLGLAGAIAGVDAAAAKGAGKMGMFQKVMLGVNLATGLLEPVAAELAVALGTMAAAAGGAAVGLGAYGLVIGNVMAEMKKLKQLQTAAATGNKAAGKALQAYLKTLTPAFQAFHNQLDATKTSYQNWGKSLEAPVLAPLVRGLKLVQPLLKQLSPVVKLAAASIGFLIDRLGTSITGGGFAKWLKAMTPAIMPAITGIGIAVGHIVVGLGGILKAFAPFVPMFMDGLDKITAKFAKWGQTLTSHSGFQSLIGLWTKSGPKVNEIFKNLVTILANVGKNMAGLATPSNSSALINILTPLSGIIARLSQNQGLVKFVLYFLLLKSTLKQVSVPLKGASDTISGITGAIKTGSGAFTAFKAGFVNSAAAASAATGIWGTAGGAIATMVTAIKGWAIWSKIAAVATKVWAGIQVAFNLVMDANPIALVVIGIAALVAAIIYAYNHFKWFRDFVQIVWRDIKGAAEAVWHWFRDAFIPFFTHTIPAAFDIFKNAVAIAWDGIKLIFLKGVYFITGLMAKLPGPLGAPFKKAHEDIGHSLDAIQADIRKHVAQIQHDWNSLHGKKVALIFSLNLPTGVSYPTRHIKGRAAGWRVPGFGGGDRHPALLEGGETVVSKEHSRLPHMLAAFRAAGVPGYAQGGSVTDTFRPPVGAYLSRLNRMVNNAQDWIISQVAKNAVFSGGFGGGGFGGGGFGGGGPGGGAPAMNARLARLMMPSWAFGSAWNAWNYVAMRESGWNQFARNPSSGAYGIPQALPPSKMGAAANPPQSSPVAQIAWMISYIRGRYGSPQAAAAHEAAFNWYDQGGWLPPGLSLAMNGTGRPERVGGGGDIYIQNLNVTAQDPASLVRGLQKYAERNGGIKLKTRQ